MSDCCTNQSSSTRIKEEKRDIKNDKPKSFIGRYLYSLGKAETEKEGKKSQGGCC